jgi:RNA polymerase sigma-70 factor (ECF subfamily)
LNRIDAGDVLGEVMTDQPLEAAQEEERRVRALYAEHGQILQGYVARLTHDPQRAEDIVQETLVRAWRRGASLTGDAGSLRSWLFTVARNLAIDEHRAGARTEPVAADAFADEADTASQLDRALETWQITEALAHLSRDHREAIVETFFRGHSVAEAAAALGVPPGTIKSRTYYGLRALRAALEEQGWGG